MFSRRPIRSTCAASLGLVLGLVSGLALWCSAWRGPTPAKPHLARRAAVTFELGRLPAGLHLTEASALRDFFTLVAADLDADGDVDVIASNGALDLLIWINDGTGRLFRQRQTSERAWRAGVTGPAYAQERPEQPESVQDDDGDAPVAHVEQTLVSHNVGVARFDPPPLHRQCSAFVRTPSSRGPPFARLSA